MKEGTPNHQNGSRAAEAEDPQEVEEEAEEEATRHKDHQEAHQIREIQSLLGPTCQQTYDPSPMLTMRDQWETSPTSSMEIEPKPKRSSTSSTITSYSTSTSLGLTPQSKRSLLPSPSSKDP